MITHSEEKRKGTHTQTDAHATKWSANESSEHVESSNLVSWCGVCTLSRRTCIQPCLIEYSLDELVYLCDVRYRYDVILTLLCIYRNRYDACDEWHLHGIAACEVMIDIEYILLVAMGTRIEIEWHLRRCSEGGVG